MTGLVDTHCHLQDPAFDEDREDVLHRALETLEWLVVVGDRLETSRTAQALVRRHVYATVGIHPHHADEADAPALAGVRDLAGHPGVVAIGEIGLDYYYEHAPRNRQREALEAQMDLASALGLPVVVHCRDAQEDMASVLDACHRLLVSGVMHCFSGDAAFAERCLAWGFHISFAGNVTFPKAGLLREAAAAVPLDRLLVETDSPYLAPQPVRGKRSEPVHVTHTARCLADLKGVAMAEFAARTTQNARRLFLDGKEGPRADSR